MECQTSSYVAYDFENDTDSLCREIAEVRICHTNDLNMQTYISITLVAVEHIRVNKIKPQASCLLVY